jgi:hypothetical protein
MAKFISWFFKLCALTLIIAIIVAAFLFFALKKGIGLDRLAIGDIKVEKLHVQLQKKLAVDIGDVTIAAGTQLPGESFDPALIRKAMMYADAAGRWFQSIAIKKISMNSIVATVAYNGDGTGALTVNTPSYSLDTQLSFSGSRLNMDVKHFKSVEYRSQASGEVHFDTDNSTMVADLLVDLAGSLPLKLHCEADRRQLSFEGSGREIIHGIKPIVEIFALGPDIQPWIADYLKGSSFQLFVIKGTIPFNAPEKVFDTLYGKASVQNCEYSFEQKLPSIKAPSTDVVFENGILKIYPHKPTYAGVDAGKSWLDINFTTSEPVLSAYIKTEAPLGDAILALLKFYNIPLPFKQTKGLTNGDLTLKINLATLDVTAKGNFAVASGSFDYDQKTYTVSNSSIDLLNDEVTIKKLNLGLLDMFKMEVTGILKVASDKADLKIAVKKIDLPFEDTRLFLDTTKRQLLLDYHQTPEGENISASESNWKIGTQTAKVAGFKASFKAATLSGTLPETEVVISPYTQARISGDFNLQQPECNLVIDMQKWESDGLLLDQAHFPATLTYGKNLEISSAIDSQWLIKGEKVQVAPFKLNYADKKIAINHAGLRLGNLLDSSFHGKFDLATGKSSLLLDRLEVDKGGRSSLEFSGKNLQAELAIKEDKTTLFIPGLGLSYERSEASGWMLHIEDFGKLYDRSALMKKYNLMKGSINVWAATDKPPFFFSGNITYPYAFFVKDNMPIDEYKFRGQYDGSALDVTINDYFHLQNSDRIRISSNDIGYNFSAIRTFVEDHPADENVTADDRIPDLELSADKSSLYLNPLQSVPADGIRLHSDNGLLKGQLNFGRGKADLEMKGSYFTLIGQDFDERLLQRVLKESKFIGGRLSFFFSGLLTEFKGVVKIEDSIMKNHTILNHIMGFIDTVPDLITFSLPEYNLQGLSFNQLYAGFAYKDHLIDVNTFALESNSIDMTGTGEINLAENTIKMDIDMISKMKKNISKIPLLGYILVGDKKQPTITLDVHGSLDEPEVNTSVYKEIVKTPFDILLRTIKLPSHLLQQIEDTIDSATTPETPPGQRKKP